VICVVEEEGFRHYCAEDLEGRRWMLLIAASVIALRWVSRHDIPDADW
jgi:hypothetical protein